MSDNKSKRGEQDRTDEYRPVPSQAEGDEETIEEDLRIQERKRREQKEEKPAER